MITDSLCRSLVLVCRSTIIAACAVAFAACSGGSSNLPPQQSEAAAKTLGIPTNGQVAVYAPGSSSPKYAIKEGIYQPSVLAFDATKTHLYVGNSTASFTVYKAGKKSLLLNVLEWNPTAIAFDASGNVYVANSSGSTCGTTDGEPTCNVVLVYPPLSKSPSGGITTGIDNPDALAFDSSGNLYVANEGGNTVTVYAAGSGTPSRTISIGIHHPDALAIDADGNLYVADACGSC